MVKDLDDDGEEKESLPDLSTLSISSGRNSSATSGGGASRSTQEEGPVASRTRAKEKDGKRLSRSGGGQATGRKASDRTSLSSPSPTLSRYGVTLGRKLGGKGGGRCWMETMRLDTP